MSVWRSLVRTTDCVLTRSGASCVPVDRATQASGVMLVSPMTGNVADRHCPVQLGKVVFSLFYLIYLWVII